MIQKKRKIMSTESEVENPLFLSCEIDGTHFTVEPMERGPDDLFRLIETVEDEDPIRFFDEIIEESDEAESFPLVCLDGQVYTLKDGELQALDISQLDFENALNCDQEKTLILSKDTEANDTDCIEITRYVSESEASPIEVTETEALDIFPDENEQLFIVKKDNINANDFAEVVTAFKCKICPYTTQDRAQLLNHFQDIHANPVFQIQSEASKNSDEVKLVYMCGECSSCFSSMDDCRKHMIEDHQLTDGGGDKPDISETDSTSASNSPTFEANVLAARPPKSPTIGEKTVSTKPRSPQSTRTTNAADANDRNVQCTYRGCFYKFSSDATMQQHAVCHLDANSFKCHICSDVKFTKWIPCSLHLWKKHEIDVDMYSCKICKAYKCTTSVKLTTHMKVHSENREYECSECGKCFKQSSQLRNHRVMHIDRKASEVPRWYTSKTCDYCGKTYAGSKCLKNHIQAVHSKLRPYVCNICGHSSARKAMLQLHLRQHTGDKPFNCEQCDYKTGDHNSLRRHMMTHTGVRPYKCPHCPYSAIQSNSYKNHLRSKHPLLSGLFTCDLCPFKTVKNESYLQHVGDHQKGLIKTAEEPKKDGENFEVFPGNIAAAQLIYSCLGAFSEVGKPIEASLMSASTSVDGNSQTITIQIPSKHLEGSLPISESTTANTSAVEQEDDDILHCFLKFPREEEENIDEGGITIPAEPEEESSAQIVVDS